MAPAWPLLSLRLACKGCEGDGAAAVAASEPAMTVEADARVNPAAAPMTAAAALLLVDPVLRFSWPLLLLTCRTPNEHANLAGELAAEPAVVPGFCL
eukprot:scaffold5581_cov229-Prasinococcus_capsulatus_cf.AAC.5